MGIEGIIRPPPEIRAVAHKTALFVSKNGRAFETRILSSAKGKTPKFAFLHETSPFHKYYEERILFYQNGGKDEDDGEGGRGGGGLKTEISGKKINGEDAEKSVSGSDVVQANHDDKGKVVDRENGRDSEAAPTITTEDSCITPKVATTSSRKAKSIIDPVARALLVQRSIVTSAQKEKSNIEEGENQNERKTPTRTNNDLAPSTKLIYTTNLPPKLSPVRLEIIKLTAQFVALNGKGGTFLRDLTLQEWNNQKTFGFLQPRHGDFAYFSSLVDLYRRLLAKCIYTKETSGGGVDGGTGGLKHGSLLAVTAMKKMVGLDSKTASSTDSSSISSIRYGSVAQEYELFQATTNNVSKCLEVAAYQAEHHRYRQEQRRVELEKTYEDGANGGIFQGGTSRIDWHDFVIVETIDFAMNEVVEVLPPPPPPPPPPQEQLIGGGDVIDGSSSDEDEDLEKIEVVPNYTPKVVSSQAHFTSAARTHVIDPISKKSIPIEDMTEHMRIQLLDPKWAAEKEKFMNKQKESNFVEGDMIARNVDAFAKARGDLFGSSAEELHTREEESKRRLEDANRIIREQAQMPQPRPNVLVSSSTAAQYSQSEQSGQMITPSALQTMLHPKPDILLPVSKKAKEDFSSVPTSGAYFHSSTVNREMLDPITTPQITSIVPAPLAAQEISENAGEVVDGTSGMAPGGDEETTPTILSEEDFIKSLSDPTVTLSISVPSDPNTAWNLNGQTLSVSVHVTTKIKVVKQQLQSQLAGMPVNKMQLKSPSIGFLKDMLSLAFLNIGVDNNSLELVPKTRGRRK